MKPVLCSLTSSNGEGIFQGLLETLLRDTFTPIEWEGFTPYDQLPPRPALKRHKAVSVDAKVLDRYVGNYGIPPNMILKIQRDGNHLIVRENDEPPQELDPESEVDFFSTTADDEYTFEMDSQGRVTRMVLHTGGENTPINRVP